MKRKVDDGLAQQLFNDLIKPVSAYRQEQTIIIVPDGKLHLLPFSAPSDAGHYVLASHLVTVVPSGTVFHILRHRKQHLAIETMPYLGVAAWTINQPKKTLFSGILRGALGPERSELIALPESRHEVESIASDLPKPDTVLLGSAATETQFKRLPLSQYNVLHLALHGYADIEYSDRSASHPALVPPRARYAQHYGGISVAEQSIVSETYDSIRAGIIKLLRAARLFHQMHLVPQPSLPCPT